MDNKIQNYNAKDIAFIIPTKDRPRKVKSVLESIMGQTARCGRIIIVDSGRSVEDIVMGFSSCLPVEYYRCYPPGQIRQRNMAISLLDERTPLAGFLDDDIVLENQAVESIIAFLNKCEPETAGVSFNIINNPTHRHSCIGAIFGMSSSKPGRILRSGYNTSISAVKSDIRTQWLSGGATVWKRQILNEYHHQEINARWAIGEDLIFSYPIGKKFPLYVCASARARHEHVYDHQAKSKYIYYGRTVVIWQLYFVESHDELSRLLFVWMIFGQIAYRMISGMLFLRLQPIQYACGQVIGLKMGLTAILFGKGGLLKLMHEKMI